MSIPSPCISICSIDEASGFCKGCLRTAQEVASWPYLDDREKQRMLDLLISRKSFSAPKA